MRTRVHHDLIAFLQTFRHLDHSFIRLTDRDWLAADTVAGDDERELLGSHGDDGLHGDLQHVVTPFDQDFDRGSEARSQLVDLLGVVQDFDDRFVLFDVAAEGAGRTGDGRHRIDLPEEVDVGVGIDLDLGGESRANHRDARLVDAGVDLHRVEVGEIDDWLTLAHRAADFDQHLIARSTIARVGVDDLSILRCFDFAGRNLRFESIEFLGLHLKRQLARPVFGFVLSQRRLAFASDALDLAARLGHAGSQLGQRSLLGEGLQNVEFRLRRGHLEAGILEIEFFGLKVVLVLVALLHEPPDEPAAFLRPGEIRFGRREFGFDVGDLLEVLAFLKLLQVELRQFQLELYGGSIGLVLRLLDTEVFVRLLQ